MLTQEQMTEQIRKIVKAAGSQFAAAQQMDISPAYLNDILKGRRAISDQLARRLGFRREMVYRHNPEIHE